MTPERLTDEHRLIAQTATEFVNGEVLPVHDRLEQKDWALARELVQKCGELGLLGTDVPEEYGGVDLDKVASLVVAESMSRSRVVRRHLRRPGQPDDPADLSLFGTEAQKREVPARRWSPARWSAPTA